MIHGGEKQRISSVTNERERTLDTDKSLYYYNNKITSFHNGKKILVTRAPSLRQQLASGRMLIAPGAYDAIGARLIEQAGFGAVYMTGAGTSAACGFPDFGLLTMSEMVANAAQMAASVQLPLIADADTGYGNELNVTRTVRAYEAQGVSAIHIEDQESPKRCGHLDGKLVISRGEFVSKISAAVQARRSPEFLVIARTDSRATLGLDEAVWRVNAALRAGADMAFVEAAQSLEELAAVPTLVDGPCLLNVVQGGKTPPITMQQAEDMGYKLAIVPGLMLMAAVQAGEAALSHLRATGLSPDAGMTVMDLFRRFGSDAWNDLRERFNAGARS